MKSKHIHPLLAISSLSLCLSAVRILWQLELTYLFLVWNIFLALVPYFLSKYLDQKKTIFSILIMGTCLLFLPNAAYLVTDFVHFRLSGTHATMWYDLMLFFTYGLSGILFTFFTINNLREFIGKRFGKPLRTLFMILVFPLIGYGIYLGRIERINSWDAVLHPISFLSGLWHIMTGPDLLVALKFTLLFTVFGGFVQFTFNNIKFND